MPDWREALDLIHASASCVITTHMNPDGDALGSELALAGWLGVSGQAVRIVNSDPVPPRYAFIDPGGRAETYRPGDHSRLIRDEADLVIVLDVSRRDRLGDVGGAIDGARARTLCIDHHPLDEPPPFDVAVIDSTAAATGELLFEMMAAAGRGPDREAAAGLYVAIMTDTGSFRHANTTARTHGVVARLLEHPIDVADLYDRIYSRGSEARFRLMGEALAGMDVRSGGAIVSLTVTRDMFERTGAGPAETDGLSELARGVGGCLVAALFSEVAPGQVKVSLRSRKGVDVNRIAARFGGGGHALAAGILTPGSLVDVRARVIDALEGAVRRET